MTAILAILFAMIDIDRTPVVRIGATEIVYGEIQCDAVALSSKPMRLRGKSVEEACREYEQWMYRFRLRREVIAAAFSREGCELNDADVAPFRRTPSLSDSEVRAAAEQMYVLPRALGRVYAGEEWQKVWEEDVRPIGSTFADFRGAARLWPSAADVHRYLTQDAVSRLNESFERQAREEASHAVLKRMLERRAMAAGVTFDVAADEYMRELVRALPIESLDSRFALPAGQEVFR